MGSNLNFNGQQMLNNNTDYVLFMYTFVYKIKYAITLTNEMDVDPVEFIPGYDSCICRGRIRCVRKTRPSFWTYFFAVFFSMAFGLLFFCNESMSKNIINKFWNQKSTDGTHCINLEQLQDVQNHLQNLQQKIDSTENLPTQMEKQYCETCLQDLDEKIYKKVRKALEIYDSDKIGLYDFAALYANGAIISTPGTQAYPLNQTINLFSVVNINMFSNPQNLLQANNFPGNCFAFHGTKGRVRVKLGKKINVKAVTLDHLKLHSSDRSSAPKDFVVYGLSTPNAPSEMVLGKFTYEIDGPSYQTFQIPANDDFAMYEYVELFIMNNHGKDEFTCLYRFRVHDTYIVNNED